MFIHSKVLPAPVIDLRRNLAGEGWHGVAYRAARRGEEMKKAGLQKKPGFRTDTI
jgi:hypothetical protein